MVDDLVVLALGVGAGEAAVDLEAGVRRQADGANGQQLLNLGELTQTAACGMMLALSAEAVVIRACRPDDVPAVLELWTIAPSAHASRPYLASDVERLLPDPSGSLLVAETADGIVGTLIAAWDGWRGNMYRLTVRRDRRRQGIALQLIGAGEEHLRLRGAHRITALVAREDPVAVAVWAAVGYADDHDIGRRVRNL